MTDRPMLPLADLPGWGYVYFVRDEVTRLIKIGWSRNPKIRLYQIRAQVRHPVTLLAYVRGGSLTETRLHKDLADAREHGEWFRNTPRVLSYISAIQRGDLAQPIPLMLDPTYATYSYGCES